jgi:hypothetical protein
MKSIFILLNAGEEVLAVVTGAVLAIVSISGVVIGSASGGEVTLAPAFSRTVCASGERDEVVPIPLGVCTVKF